MERACRWVGIVGLMVLAGCYRRVPVAATSTPPVGETLSFLISDRGRVGLGERMGPGVARIDGRLVETEGQQYVVSVFRVADITGQTSTWSGETIRLDREFVDRMQGRQLDKGRTWMLAAGVTAAVVYLIASRGLSGLFDGDDGPGEDDDPPDSKRARPAFRY